jgi:hypothetical protein
LLENEGQRDGCEQTKRREEYQGEIIGIKRRCLAYDTMLAVNPPLDHTVLVEVAIGHSHEYTYNRGKAEPEYSVQCLHANNG